MTRERRPHMNTQYSNPANSESRAIDSSQYCLLKDSIRNGIEGTDGWWTASGAKRERPLTQLASGVPGRAALYNGGAGMEWF